VFRIERVLLFFLLITFLAQGIARASQASYYAQLAKEEFAMKDYQSAYEDALSALDQDPENKEALAVIVSLKGVEILCEEQKKKVAMADFLASLEEGERALHEEENAGRFAMKAYMEQKLAAGSNKVMQSPSEISPKKPAPITHMPSESAEDKTDSNVHITGKIRLAGEVNSDGDILWKDANPDKNAVPYEKNWRYIWGEEHENTFDPKVYDRLELNIDTDFPDAINLYAQLVLDPWSYVGTIDAEVTSTNGLDSANVRLKYFFATGQTMNETFRTKYGNILVFNNIKVVDGKLSPYTPTGIYDWYTDFNTIGGEDLHERWNIIRKLWFDYGNESDGFSGKVFLISSQQEALKSDDLMRLSDNRKDWEESPWIDTYSPSRRFLRPGYPLKGGKWQHNISAYVRDSEWERLTYLRGASFSIKEGSVEGQATIALPMTLWDDYSDVNSLDGATRWKYYFEDDSNDYIGAFFSSKLGFNDSDDLEAENYVWAIDGAKQLFGVLVSGEVAHSSSTIDEANDTKTYYDDYAYGIKFQPLHWPINKIEFYYNYMGDKFSPGLSSYRYTRIETEASKHITFDEEENRKKGIETYGDGIDRGRSAAGIYANFDLWNTNWDVFVRNVHSDGGVPIETLGRLEATASPVDKLTLKALAWYKALPDTEVDKDPLIYADNLYDISDYYSGQNEALQNTAIEAGKDPSIGHFGIAGRYDIDDNAYFELGFEETNDPMVFPRVLLCSTYVTDEIIGDYMWDKIVPFLYDQSIFGLPPYDYYHIIKMKTGLTPLEDLQLTFSFTKNQNKYAMPGIDDNGSHFGFEALYKLGPKAEMFFSYTYSRLYDVYKYEIEGNLDYESHNNFFVGYKYNFSEEEYLKAMWGEYAGYDSDSDYWHMSALDTRHIFRLVYEKQF